MRWAA